MALLMLRCCSIGSGSYLPLSQTQYRPHACIDLPTFQLLILLAAVIAAAIAPTMSDMRSDAQIVVTFHSSKRRAQNLSIRGHLSTTHRFGVCACVGWE